MGKREYKDAEGKPVPSVTTIIKSSLGGWGTEGLIKWAWQKGMEQIDYAHIRDEAATVGQVAHHMIEAFIKDETPQLEQYPDHLVEQAGPSFEQFLQWYMAHPMDFHVTELKLVHPRYRYGGTMDAVVSGQDNKRRILDYKSGKGVYAEVIAQVAAYAELYESIQMSPITGATVLHINREGTEFRVFEYDADDLAIGTSLFFNALTQYELKRKAEAIHRREKKKHERRPTPDPEEVSA